jgi:hypothetical protein
MNTLQQLAYNVYSTQVSTSLSMLFDIQTRYNLEVTSPVIRCPYCITLYKCNYKYDACLCKSLWYYIKMNDITVHHIACEYMLQLIRQYPKCNEYTVFYKCPYNKEIIRQTMIRCKCGIIRYEDKLCMNCYNIYKS